MQKILTVAWREFRHTALTKAFIFAALGVPALVALLIALAPLFMRSTVSPLKGTLAVIAPDDAVIGTIRNELSGDALARRVSRMTEEGAPPQPPTAAAGTTAAGAGGAADAAELATQALGGRTPVELSVERVAAAEEESLKEQVRAGEIAALAIVPASTLARPQADSSGSERDGGTFQLIVPPDMTPNHTLLLRGAISEAVARARAALAGVDYDAMRALLRAPTAEISRMERGGGQGREQIFAKMIIPAAFMLLLWMSVFVSANYLLTTTVEEKGSKVMEVLLSAVSPMQLMAGKILGQGLVSAVMLVAYGGLGLVSLGVLVSSDLVPALHLVYLVLFYIMAYFMIASIMAGVGSAANDMHEAQSLIGPAMMIIMIPLMLWFPISQSPNGLLATATSFVPPLIPFVMILRVTAANEPVAVWQILLSLLWGYTAMIGMVWLAARVFRVGVLMQGKPPTPRELLRWIAYR
jgi:ABC-type Na+ efflux pump permease subunit